MPPYRTGPFPNCFLYYTPCVVRYSQLEQRRQLEPKGYGLLPDEGDRDARQPSGLARQVWPHLATKAVTQEGVYPLGSFHIGLRFIVGRNLHFSPRPGFVQVASALQT